MILVASVMAFALIMIWLEPEPKSARRTLSIAGVRAGYAEVLAHPIAYVFYTSVFIEGLSIYGIMPFVAGRLESRGLGGLTEAGLVIGAMSAGGIAFTLTVSRLLARFGRNAVIRGGGAVCALALVAYLNSRSWQAEALCFAVLGFGFFMVHNCLQAIGTELAPRVRGSSVALFAFSLFLGQAVGPILYGPVIARFGADVPVIIAAILMPAMSLVVAYVLSKSALSETSRS
jgi:predicted MFS family arabinose efflux permease